MNIVITGATSFIGLALLEELKKEHRLFAIVRPDSVHKGLIRADSVWSEGVWRVSEHRAVGDQLRRPGVSLIELDLTRLTRLREVRMPGASEASAPGADKETALRADVWIHMGWDGSGSKNRTNGQLQQANIAHGREAVLTASGLGCRRFLFAGSQAEYGIHQTKITEESLCSPVSEYGKAKLEAGNQIKGLCKTLNIEYIHTRIFSVYGEGDHPWTLVHTCLDTFLAGGRMELGACTQLWNFLYIEDMAKAMAALAFQEHLESGIYNIAGDDTRVLREFVEEMHSLCGGRGVCAYGERQANAEGLANLNPDISKIRRATGWSPEISFREGIARMIRQRDNAGRE